MPHFPERPSQHTLHASNHSLDIMMAQASESDMPASTVTDATLTPVKNVDVDVNDDVASPSDGSPVADMAPSEPIDDEVCVEDTEASAVDAQDTDDVVHTSTSSEATLAVEAEVEAAVDTAEESTDDVDEVVDEAEDEVVASSPASGETETVDAEVEAASVDVAATVPVEVEESVENTEATDEVEQEDAVLEDTTTPEADATEVVEAEVSEAAPVPEEEESITAAPESDVENSEVEMEAAQEPVAEVEEEVKEPEVEVEVAPPVETEVKRESSVEAEVTRSVKDSIMARQALEAKANEEETVMAKKSSEPKKTSRFGGADKCVKCEKSVYAMEKITCDETIYHKKCLRCNHCDKILTLGEFAGLEGVMYCKPHFKSLFALKGNYDESFGKEAHAKKWAK